MAGLIALLIGGALVTIGIALIETYEALVDAFLQGNETVRRAAVWLGLVDGEK